MSFETQDIMLVKLLFKVLGALHFAFLYITMFFTGNVLPTISLLFVQPFSPSAHERLLCFLADANFSSIVDWAEIVGGVDLIITGDQMPGSAVVMSNHVSFSDTILIHAVARRYVLPAFSVSGQILSFLLSVEVQIIVLFVKKWRLACIFFHTPWYSVACSSDYRHCPKWCI